MSVLKEVLEANDAYAASFGSKSELALPPARGFAILTCMDARLDPAKYAGLSEGDAHVIRNAGGRASDEVIRGLLANSLETAALGADGFYDVKTGRLVEVPSATKAGAV